MPSKRARRWWKPHWATPGSPLGLRATVLLAGANAGLAVIGGWVTNPIARVAVVAIAATLGAYLFAKTQAPPDKLPQAHGEQPELGRSPHHEPPRPTVMQDPVVTAGPPGTRGRRLVKTVLTVAAAVVVWFRDVRERRARRQVRLRPQMLPPRLTYFRGRARDLEWLRDRYDQLDGAGRPRRRGAVSRQRPRRQASAADKPSGRPLMLFLYGGPGVGKTALASELAHELRASYPDGQLYVNLGVAGGRRSPRDILRVFLRELGWPEDELREAVQLGEKFRAATAKRRLLIVLDSARDTRQIEAVLPGGDRCAVIVTSRANLAGTEQRAWRVGTTTPAEAARILTAYLAADADLPSDSEVPAPELIAEAAEQCGRQPIALRAIGEKARHTHGGLETVVSELRDPQERLEHLAYGGRDASERIATEYDLLGRRLQAALQALVLVEAPSFVPWVLQPLLGTTLPESANLMAALSEVGLLDEFQTDPTGFPRYEFSPLVRLFAQHELHKTLESDAALVTEAKFNLRRGLLLLAKEVMSELYPRDDFGVIPGFRPEWVPTIPDWKRTVAAHAGFWIRAEFPNLIEAIREAHECGLYLLTWKLSAQLTDCDVFHAFTDAVRDAFERARGAAASADDTRARALVLFAEGSCQLAGERCADAVTTLTDALREAERLGDHLLVARVSQRIGQAERRGGRYDVAASHLQMAQDALAHVAPDGRQAGEIAAEAGIIASLHTENVFDTNPAGAAGTYPDPQQLGVPGASACFTEYVVAARAARRRNDFAACRTALGKAADAIDGYERFAFQLRLQRIACSLKSPLTPADLTDLVADAANLVVVADAAGATVSGAEARILLAAALLASGDPARSLNTVPVPAEAVLARQFGDISHVQRLLRAIDLTADTDRARAAVPRAHP